MGGGKTIDRASLEVEPEPSVDAGADSAEEAPTEDDE